MALDFIIVGLSLLVFIFYLVILFFLIEITKRVNKKIRITFIYLILAILFLIIRRLQQIFLESQILHFIPYLSEITTLMFAVFLFLAIFNFYREIKRYK